MSGKTRFPIVLAEATAGVLIKLLTDSCERIGVAGSLRRQRGDVGDIELLCVPKPAPGTTDMFGNPTPTKESLLDLRCAELIQNGHLALRPNINGATTFGPMNKLLIQTNTQIPIDIFSTTEANWGMAMVVRTGPVEFNKRMMARFLKLGMQGHAYGGVTQGDTEIQCPDEETVFNLLGWELQEPKYRHLTPPLRREA